MSVYVDPLMNCVRSKAWKYARSCHLFADTPAELHALANKCGLKRAWFQDDDYFPNYDLTFNKRNKAVMLGAVPLSRELAVAKFHEIIHKLNAAAFRESAVKEIEAEAGRVDN